VVVVSPPRVKNVSLEQARREQMTITVHRMLSTVTEHGLTGKSLAANSTNACIR